MALHPFGYSRGKDRPVAAVYPYFNSVHPKIFV
jgi:hypothetical protein